MKFSDLLRMSINNLRRRKLRTGLTVLGVVIGTASIVVMVSLGIGLKEITVEQYESSGSLTKIEVYRNYGMGGSENEEDGFITDKTIESFKGIPHVKAVSPVLSTYVHEIPRTYWRYSFFLSEPVFRRQYEFDGSLDRTTPYPSNKRDPLGGKMAGKGGCQTHRRR